MAQLPIWVPLIILSLIFSVTNSETDEVKKSLVEFMNKLYPEYIHLQRDLNWGWNDTSDPCTDKWRGVTCDTNSKSVRKIVLDQLNLTGVFYSSSLCKASSLFVLSINGNNVSGDIKEDISNCRHLTHLYLSANSLSGNLPVTLSKLSNLKRLVISNNDFSGELPDLSRISGLLSFVAQNNNLTGKIPNFDFSNLVQFNVSYNNFNGPIPEVNGRFSENSFLGNPQLCGKPLLNICPSTVKKESKGSSRNKILIYSGYVIIGLIVFLLVAFKLFKKIIKPKEKKNNHELVDTTSDKTSVSNNSSEFKNGGNRSEYSITTSVESSTFASQSSLVVLTSPVANGRLRFEDLLRAPAEMMGRGKNGSLYKVVTERGVNLAVKRIKNWGISRQDFKRRMKRIDQVKHPKVLPVFAYYCSKQEKLLVYEFQQNGSLFKLLHESKNGQSFDWGSRLTFAATIAESLAFMHTSLRDDGIAHGNLKSSNILLNNDMEPCISEYGLMVIENHDHSSFTNPNDKKSFENNTDPTNYGRAYSTFKVDIYALGVVLLELLTGKIVEENNGFDLAKWVHSVVREEWTVEVFDKALVSEGASEERMVNLLQVALKCINPSPEARPSADQVVVFINTIKEEEEMSLTSDS